MTRLLVWWIWLAQTPPNPQDPWARVKAGLESARTSFGNEVKWGFGYVRSGILILFAAMVIGLLLAYVFRMAGLRWLEWMIDSWFSTAAVVIGFLAFGSILISLF